MERETLRNMEGHRAGARGSAYIEGIARVFEARNYLTMLTGLGASLAGIIAQRWGLWWSLGAAAAAGALCHRRASSAMGGLRIGDIAYVETGHGGV